MKNRSILAARLLLIAIYVLKKDNINFTLSLKNIVINMISLAFMIRIFAIKNVINIYKKIIVFDTKNM